MKMEGVIEGNAQQYLNQILEEVKNFSPSSQDEYRNFKKKFEDKGGVFDIVGKIIRGAPPHEKPLLGKIINEIRTLYKEKIEYFKGAVIDTSAQRPSEDVSLWSMSGSWGSLSPLSLIIDRVVRIFTGMGYRLAEGPELEDDWHNFTALNFPEEHPARDMQDTIFVKGFPVLLRTHTSNVQIRTMEKTKPPLKVICVGRVFRNERISARSHFQFHQVEGLAVDKNVSFGHLKYDIERFVCEMFGEGTQLRFRPSYFPFTTPSAEVDISCLICNRKGCPVCKGTGWVEIMGCGIVHPAVLKNCNIDYEEWSGFAFGMGIERIAMLKFQISDIRLFYTGNIKFTEQFNNLIL